MRALRRVVFWLHLVTGATAGAVILVMSVTGVLLAFEPQLVAYADRDLGPVAPPHPDARRLSLDVLVARAQALRGEARPTAVVLQAAPGSLVRVAFGRDDVLAVNPYTGDVAGRGSRTRAVLHAIQDWHRWLGSREWLRPVSGAANLAFVGLALSGVVLWWPRAWTRAALRAVAVPDPRLTGRARDFNWHNAAGVWCAAVLLVIALTGVVMSYPWASDLLYVVAGDTPPPRAAASRETGRRERARAGVSLDTLAARAETQLAGWHRIMLRLPQRPDGPVTASIFEAPAWGPTPRSQLSLDPTTGAVLRWEPYATAGPGRKLRTWVRYLHTGEVFGVGGQLVAGLASTGGVVLVVTGLSLAWRRVRAWRARVRPIAHAPVAVNAVSRVAVDADR